MLIIFENVSKIHIFPEIEKEAKFCENLTHWWGSREKGRDLTRFQAPDPKLPDWTIDAKGALTIPGHLAGFPGPSP